MAVAIRRPHVQRRLKLLVEKDDASWLDLSDGLTHDRLLAISGIEARMEVGVGVWDVPVITLTVDNTDRFWSGSPPSGVSAWYRRRIRLDEITADGTLTRAYYLLDDWPQTASDKDVATLKGVSRMTQLLDKDASRVRNGQQAWVNKGIGFLAQRALEQEFSLADVASWVAAGTILSRYQIPLADPSTRALSHFARLPESANVQGTWYGNALLWVSDANAPAALKNKLVFAEGGELWTWDPATEAAGETKITDVATLGLTSDYQIMRLFWCADSGVRKVIGIAWRPDTPAAYDATTQRDRSGAKGGVVRMFQTDGTTSTLYAAPSLPAGLSITTGYFAARVGRQTASLGLVIGGGQPGNGDANQSGFNMPVPQGSWLQLVRRPSGRFGPLQGCTGASVTASTTYFTTDPTWGNAPPTWYARSWDHTAVDDRPFDDLFNCGQSRGAFAMQRTGKYLAFYTIEWDATNKVYHYRLWRLDCSSSTGSPSYQYYRSDTTVWATSGGTPWLLQDSSRDLQPYALEFSPDDVELLTCCCYWGESAWSGGAPVATDLIGHILGITWPSVGVGTRYFKGSDPGSTPQGAQGTDLQYGIPLAASYNAANALDNASLLAAVFLRADALTWAAGLLKYHTSGVWSDRWQAHRDSAGQPLGLVYASDTQRFYWVESTSNMLVSTDATSNTAAPTVEDSGEPPVYQDSSLTAGLVNDGAGTLYGVSGPGLGTQANTETQGAEIVGKRYLWKFANTLTDRIECLGYQEGEGTLLDLLTDMAQLADLVLYVDPATDAIALLPRPSGTGFADTFITQGLEVDQAAGSYAPTVKMDACASSPRAAEIFNYVELRPVRAVLGNIAHGASIQARPSDWGRPPWNGNDSTFGQTNQRRVNVVLRCVQGGTAGLQDDGCFQTRSDGKAVVDVVTNASTQAAHKVRFAWQEFAALVETQLVNDVGSASTTLTVPAAAATGATAGPVGQGDLVHLDVGVDRTITAIDVTSQAGHAILTLDSATPIGVTYPAGQHVVIRDAQTNTWSDAPAGVTTLALALPATLPTLNGTITDTATSLTLSSATGADQGSVITIGTEDILLGTQAGPAFSACTRGYNGTTAASHTTGAAVTIRTVRVDSTAMLGPGLVLRVGTGLALEDLRYTRDLDGAHGYATRAIGGTSLAAHAVSDPVQAYWAPIIDADYPANTPFAIGGTGLWARPNVPASGEAPVMLGDEVAIAAPGLVLQADPATVIEQDQASITRYTKRPWTGRQSRLWSYRQCVEAAARILAFASAHESPSFDGKAKIYPAINTPYGARDPREIPWVDGVTTANGDAWNSPRTGDTNDTLACQLRGYRYDPITDRLHVDLWAVNANATG